MSLRESEREAKDTAVELERRGEDWHTYSHWDFQISYKHLQQLQHLGHRAEGCVLINKILTQQSMASFILHSAFDHIVQTIR